MTHTKEWKFAISWKLFIHVHGRKGNGVGRRPVHSLRRGDWRDEKKDEQYMTIC